MALLAPVWGVLPTATAASRCCAIHARRAITVGAMGFVADVWSLEALRIVQAR